MEEVYEKAKNQNLKEDQKGPGYHLESTTGRRISAGIIGKTRIEGKRVLLIRVDL
jgi:hypothetical protein